MKKLKFEINDLFECIIINILLSNICRYTCLLLYKLRNSIICCKYSISIFENFAA